MNSRRSRVIRRWSTAPAAIVRYEEDPLAVTETQPDPPRERLAGQLGPYEARYDVALGYGMERQIVQP